MWWEVHILSECQLSIAIMNIFCHLIEHPVDHVARQRVDEVVYSKLGGWE